MTAIYYSCKDLNTNSKRQLSLIIDNNPAADNDYILSLV